MPFKMMGKSPLMKKLVGKQGNLPPALKAEIKASPGKMVSPLKEDKPFIKEGSLGADVRDTFNEYSAKLRSFRKANLAKTDAYLKKEGIDRGGEKESEDPKARKKQQTYQQSIIDASNKKADAKKADAKKAAAEKSKNKSKVKEQAKSPEVKKPVQGKSFLNTGSFSAGKGSIKTPSTSGSPAMPSFTSKSSQSGKKVINRGSSFTDEYGNTYDRSVKGRKKDDGSSYKTISNKTNDKTTREKDVAKGPKVKGKRRSKTVIKSKFDREGNIRKVVEKTRGQKRKNLSDSEIIKRRENLKADRKKRDESPTKMKTKTPSKMMKKSPSKMMKKKSKSTSKPSKSNFLSKLESKGTIKSSKNLTAAEKKKLASMKTGPAKMMKKKK